MSAADGYVMSSAWEGMPMVRSRRPRRAFPSSPQGRRQSRGGLSETSGFLVRPEGRDAGSGDLRLGQAPRAERLAMGERGREHIRSRYGLGRVAERWEDLYREVLARKGLAVAPQLPTG